MATEPSGSAASDLQVADPAPGGAGTAGAGPGRRHWWHIGGIFGFIVRRTLLGVLVLFLVSLIVFAATQALGDPARAILGRTATPSSLAALQKQLNLDQPVLQQYWNWIRRPAARRRGHRLLGRRSRSPTTSRIGSSTRSFLVLLAGGISIPLSVAIGAYAALRRDASFDVVTSVITLAFAALPEFVVGLFLVVLFSTTVTHWLPAIAAPGVRPWNDLEGMILPTLTLVIAVTPYVRADHARLDDRGARERLRRDGAAEGPARAARC